MPTYSTPDPISASIDITMGDIRIAASQRSDTVVELAPSNSAIEADVRAAEQAQVEFADGRLRVIGPKRRTVGLKKTGSVDVTLAVPTGSNVEVATSVGAVHGAGVLGDCRIRTSAGDIRLQRTGRADLRTGIGAVEVDAIAGEAQCTTGSGTVRITGIDGRAYVKNSNGDTRLGDVRGDLRIKAANGDIFVDRARTDINAATANGTIWVGCVERGTVQLKTALGQVDVGILAGTAARLDVHTSYGAVRSALDATERPLPTDATVDVHVESSCGDIVIRRCPVDESSPVRSRT